MGYNPLSHLIWTLDAGEKKMVRKVLRTNKQTDQSNFLQLFDLIDQHRNVQRTMLDEKMKSLSIKNLPATKHQLYHMILDIVSSHINSFDNSYYQRASKIEYLLHKAMYSDALKQIRALKADVVKNERFAFLRDLLFKELTALRAMGSIEECKHLAKSWRKGKQANEIRKQGFEDVFNEYYRLYLRYCGRGSAFTHDEQEKYRAFINESFINKDKYMLDVDPTPHSTVYYHKLALLVSNLALNKFTECYRHSARLLEILESFPKERDSDIHQHAMLLYNHGLACYFSNRTEEFNRIVTRLQEKVWNSIQGEEGFYELFYNRMLRFLMEEPDLDVTSFRNIESQAIRLYEKILKKPNPITRRRTLRDIEDLLTNSAELSA